MSGASCSRVRFVRTSGTAAVRGVEMELRNADVLAGAGAIETMLLAAVVTVLCIGFSGAATTSGFGAGVTVVLLLTVCSAGLVVTRATDESFGESTRTVMKCGCRFAHASAWP